jgi:dienelactone hydrolase
MRKKLIIGLLLLIILAGAFVLIFRPFSSPPWVLEEVSFKARDGFKLEAFLLRPKKPGKKYPAVACLHQLWGNRDDFLKFFPYLAESGIVAIAPNFPRQRPNLSPRRITDLRDTVDYLETLEWVDPEKLGIITASFSVETGLIAVRGKKNVIADVMISGPVLSEGSRKWVTQNSDLAIFTVSSIYDGKPGDPPKHHLMMEELIARSLNPFSRSWFIDDKVNRFSIFAHGTFVFDEFPESLRKFQTFFEEVFGITERENGVIKRPLPKYTVYFTSKDGFPVAATFKQPRIKKAKIPAVILYPPQFRSRTFYDGVINPLISRGIAVLAPNTKRTCRARRTVHLCDKELGGAVAYLESIKSIDGERVGILLPSFYFLAAKELMEKGQLPVRTVFFMDTGGLDFGVNPRDIEAAGYEVHFLDGVDFKKMVSLIKRKL